MRQPVDPARIRAFARALGREARADTKLYLTGGASAVLRGWRRAISRLKDDLDLNVKLASPPDFIPELPERAVSKSVGDLVSG